MKPGPWRMKPGPWRLRLSINDVSGSELENVVLASMPFATKHLVEHVALAMLLKFGEKVRQIERLKQMNVDKGKK